MNNTPTPIDLDNFPLNEALRFADENSTTGGLVTQAALKTLAAGCRELTAAREELKAVTEHRDRLADGLKWIAGCNHQLFDENTAMQMRDKAEQALQSLTQDHSVAANDMIADRMTQNGHIKYVEKNS